jgi:hypothetical protein
MLADDVTGTQAGVMRLRPARCAAAPRVSAVPDGASFFWVWCDSTMSQSQPASACAARSTSSSSTATPRLKFEAQTSGIFAAAASSAWRCVLEMPVVPDTSPAPLHAQRQHRVEALRQAEVDRHIEHRRAGQLAGAEERHAVDHALGRRTAGHRSHDLQGFGMFGGQPQQGLAHAPGGTVNEQSQGSLVHACRLAAARLLRQAPSLLRCMPFHAMDGSSLMQISEQLVLVTGAGRGLGQHIARAFAAQGARVIVNYHRSEGAARALAAELGGQAIALPADVTDRARSMRCCSTPWPTSARVSPPWSTTRWPLSRSMAMPATAPPTSAGRPSRRSSRAACAAR